jgi:hypothetical protein
MLSVDDNPQNFKTQEVMLPVAADTPYKSIQVTEIQPGQDDTVATFTVKIGSVLVRRVSLRRGRGDSIFVNWPSFKNEHGRWVHLVEIVSPSLEAAVREEIHRACSEVAA